MKSLKILLSFLFITLTIGFVNSQISTFPYQEGFETGVGNWIQFTGDDFDWTRNQNGTPTLLTGPSAAFEGNWYMYAEADGNNNNVTLLYAEFDFNTAGVTEPKFEFYYHMYNALILPPFFPDVMGTLELLISTDGGSTINTLWSISGNQGNQWHKVLIDLTSYASNDDVLIGFRATIGNGNRSDIAIDDINVYDPVFNCIPIPYTQDFNASSSLPTDWSTDNPSTWVINTNWQGSAPPTGNHLNTTVGASTVGNVYTNCFDVAGNNDLHVRFYHYWQPKTGLLPTQDGTFYGSPDGGVTVYSIDQWNVNTTTEEGWQEYDISSWADGASRLIFWWEINGSHLLFGDDGYWNIDDFEVKEGPWLYEYTWTGTVSTDWNTGGNWDSGFVPDEDIDVIIPGGAPNYPEIIGVLYIGNNYGGAACKSLTIENGGEVNVVAYGQLYAFGDVTVENGGSLNVNRLQFGINGALYINGGDVYVGIESAFPSFLDGFMSTGTLTLYNTISFDNTDWYANGGTVILGSSSGSAYLLVNGTIDLFDMEIMSGTDVTCDAGTINAGGDLTIYPSGGFKLNAGTFNVSGNSYFEADNTGMAAFIDNGTFNVSGTTTVEQYLTSERWHLVSAPISNATINTYFDIYLREYDEPTDSWAYLVNPTTLPMNVTEGYSAWASDDYTGTTTVSFVGSLNAGIDYPIASLSYTAGNGWNVLGNPYPAPLQWNNTWSKTDLSDWACVHNNGNDECYNAATNTGWPNPGDMADGIIPSTQGFWVRATSSSASVTIPASERMFSDQAFYKESAVTVNESIRLRIDGNNDFDAMLLQFIPDATTGYDPRYDLEKRWGYDESPQIYSIIDENTLFSVNVLPELYSGLVIPAGFQVGAPGEYTLTLTQLENMKANLTIVLEDIRENTFTQMNINDTYVFTAEPIDESHRFNIHFKDATIGINDNLGSGANVYAYDDIVYIQTSGGQPSLISIYDVTGREIENLKSNAEDIIRIKVTEGTGYYVVKVLTDKDLTTQKVFIK
ncbi:MAG: T9SS type A sorting domain-containing protein [Bacteroidales bacterium]|nr:T9SS type A sorting domain-containing protein [Bacteroidales bacterium]